MKGMRLRLMEVTRLDGGRTTTFEILDDEEIIDVVWFTDTVSVTLAERRGKVTLAERRGK